MLLGRMSINSNASPGTTQSTLNEWKAAKKFTTYFLSVIFFASKFLFLLLCIFLKISIFSCYFLCTLIWYFFREKLYANFKITEEKKKLDEAETALNDRFPLTLTAACKTDLRNKVLKKGQSDFDSEPKLL